MHVLTFFAIFFFFVCCCCLILVFYCAVLDEKYKIITVLLLLLKTWFNDVMILACQLGVMISTARKFFFWSKKSQLLFSEKQKKLYCSHFASKQPIGFRDASRLKICLRLFYYTKAKSEEFC